MNQQTLALEATTPGHADHPSRPGFELGWDHARHGLMPPAALLVDGTPVSQGWRAGKAVFGRHAAAAPRAVRQWLELRMAAWRAGVAFDAQELGAARLSQLEVTRCPVLRRPLGGARGEATAPVFVRLDPALGYVAGNVAQISTAAAQARDGVDLLAALRRARRAEAAAEPVAGLDAGAWWRLAVLGSFALPLRFFEAAQLPLAVLPPAQVRMRNAVQRLQRHLTLQFAAPGWGERLRAIAGLLPAHTLRHDFNLFVGALLPRVLDAARLRLDARQALEDAWLAERVQRRWQHFALSLGEAGCEALLARVAASTPPAAVPPAVRRRTDRPPRRPAPRATASHRPSTT